ncbi:MAG: hypothetical protein ACHP7N_04485 [Caulobacterales bacterium]
MNTLGKIASLGLAVALVTGPALSARADPAAPTQTVSLTRTDLNPSDADSGCSASVVIADGQMVVTFTSDASGRGLADCERRLSQAFSKMTPTGVAANSRRGNGRAQRSLAPLS